MTVFIKGAKIQTPIDQNTYLQLVSEPHVPLTRINEDMCSYSRYRRRRQDSDDVYGPNFEDEESYYRFRNEQNNYQSGFQNGYLSFNDGDNSYRNNFGGFQNHRSSEFTRPARLRNSLPPQHRFIPYRPRDNQYHPPNRGRQRGGRPPAFAIPRRLPQKKWQHPSETLPASTRDEASESPNLTVQSAKVNSSEDAIVKESSLSDSLCSQDKPVQKSTSALLVSSCETLPEKHSGDQSTNGTVIIVENSDIKTENNTTMDLETVCFETPAVEDIVDFIDHDEVVQSTDFETFRNTKEQPTATSTPLYEHKLPSDVPTEKLEKLSVPDFVIDVKASYLSKSPPSESNKKTEDQTNEATMIDAQKMFPRSNSSNIKEKRKTDQDFVIDKNASYLPKTAPNKPKKKNEEQTNETTIKDKSNTTKMVNVVEKINKVNDNNKEKISVHKSNSTHKVAKRRITDESEPMEPKLPKLDVKASSSSRSIKTKESKNVSLKTKVQGSTNSTSKKDEERSRKSSENSVPKSVRKDVLQINKAVGKDVQSNPSNKIRILENIRLNSEYVNKSSSPKQDQDSHQEKMLKRSKEIFEKTKQVEKIFKNQHSKPPNEKTDPLAKNDSKIKPKKPIHLRKDKGYNCALKKIPILQNGKKDKRIKPDHKQNQLNKSIKKRKDPVIVKEQPVVPENPDETSLKVEKVSSFPKQQESSTIIDSNCASKKLSLFKNENKDKIIKLDKKHNQFNDLAKKQKDPVSVKEPQIVSKKSDDTPSKHASLPKQQETVIDYNCASIKLSTLQNGNNDKGIKLDKKQNQYHELTKKQTDSVCVKEPLAVAKNLEVKPLKLASTPKQQESSSIITEYNCASKKAPLVQNGNKGENIKLDKKRNQSHELTKKQKGPVCVKEPLTNAKNPEAKPLKLASTPKQQESSSIITEYNCASKRAQLVQNRNKDESIKLDNTQSKFSESNKRQNDFVTVNETPVVPEKQDNTLLKVEKPALLPKQQETSPIITMEERIAINTMENKKSAVVVKTTPPYRRKSVDVGVLIHRNELSNALRKRRAKSVGPITDAGDYFTEFRLTRSKSQELGATLITDVVDFYHEHKKLNLQNTKPVSSRRASNYGHDQNIATYKSNSFKLIDVSGSLNKDPRLNKNAVSPQLLTKEQFMESLGQSGNTTSLKDYRFNFEKSPTNKYDKIEYVNTKTASLLRSPLHEHLSFSIESKTRGLARADDKKPRRESVKSTDVSQLPILIDNKGSSAVKKVYLNPASPPHAKKAQPIKCSVPQSSENKKILTNVLEKNKRPQFAKREPLFATFSSKASNVNKINIGKCQKPANTTSTLTSTNPIAKRKKRGRQKKKKVSDNWKSIIYNVKDTTIHPVPKNAAVFAHRIKNVNPVPAPNRNTAVGQSKPGNAPATTSTILKDCLLHEDIDKYFPSNSVNGSSMVLNVGDVSVLMTEKGCKKVSHETVETLPDEQWQKVEEFLVPKPSMAKTSMFKGAAEEIDRDMSLHEVIGPENIIPVKCSTPATVLKKSTTVCESSINSEDFIQQPLATAQNSFYCGSLTVTPIPPKTTIITDDKLVSNSLTVTPIMPGTTMVAKTLCESNNIQTPIPPNTASVAENGFNPDDIRAHVISKSTGIAENSVGLENTYKHRTVPMSNPSKPTVTAEKISDHTGMVATVVAKDISVPPSTPSKPTTAGAGNIENPTVPVPISSNPTALAENSSGRENINEIQTVREPTPSRPTVIAENNYGSGNVNVMSNGPKTATVAETSFGQKTLQAVVSQVGCNAGIQPTVNFSVTIPIVAQQPPVKRVSHHDLAAGLVPFIYRLLIYKNERHTFKSVREKMNRKIVSTEKIIADWKILKDAYSATFQYVGCEMISYLKEVETKKFQLALLLKEVESLFVNNGFSSVNQSMILFILYDVYVSCQPVTDSEFFVKLWKEVDFYASYILKRKLQPSSNAPVREQVAATVNRQNPINNNHPINTTITNNNVSSSALNYQQQTNNASRKLISIAHSSNQGPTNIGQNTVHHYSLENQSNTQYSQIGDITTYNAKNPTKSTNNNLVAISQCNSNKKQLPNLPQNSQMSKQNSVNQQSAHNYGRYQRSNSLPGQGQEMPNSRQNVALPPTPQSILSPPMEYNNHYYQSVMYNSMYQQNYQQGISRQLQNVGSHNQYGNPSNYPSQSMQNVNNYSSSLQVQPHVPLGRQGGCSVYPPQYTVLPPSYYQSYPSALPQIQHSALSGMQNTVHNIRNNYNRPENSVVTQQSEKGRKDKSSDNTRNSHLPRVQSAVPQTLYPVHNSLSTQRVTQNNVNSVPQQLAISQQSSHLPRNQPLVSQTLPPVHNSLPIPRDTQNVSVPPLSELTNLSVNAGLQQLMVPQQSSHLQSKQPPVSQTFHSVYNSLPTQRVTQNVSVPPPPELTNSNANSGSQRKVMPQESQDLTRNQPPVSQTMHQVYNSLSIQSVPAPLRPSEISNSIPQQVVTLQRPQYTLSDLLRSNQFAVPRATNDSVLDNQNAPNVAKKSGINDKEVEQTNHQATSLSGTTGKDQSEKDIPLQEPPIRANSADNFKIYLPPQPFINTINKQVEPEKPVSPVNVPAKPTNDDTKNLMESDIDGIIKINDSEDEEDAEPEYISFEKWVELNQEVIDLEDYEDLFESKFFKQDIKNEMNNDSFEGEDTTVEEFPPEVSSPDSGICTPRADELNLCFCGVKAAFVCSCRNIIYCSRRCQEVDWESHQKDCRSQ